ncbi:restriction alleviation protein, Lar family [Ochrobactrum phage vB_OspM_OC]|nr:restriction alleviation protein, Lar family [Ochrobactrum phage vB_OspM_OC]
MKTYKIRTCPMCGDNPIVGRGGESWRPYGWNIRCESGHVMTPDMDTLELAINWWNRRAPAHLSRKKVEYQHEEEKTD